MTAAFLLSGVKNHDRKEEMPKAYLDVKNNDRIEEMPEGIP